MDRTVPKTGSGEIELYIRTYYSLLRSTAEVKIRTLEEAHANMGSSLHPKARSQDLDMSAFIYTSLRLPTCIAKSERVILGQSWEMFKKSGYGDVESWEPVTAKARRRPGFFDNDSTLAIFVASRSDIDDIVPMLTAFQFEWNKLHYKLRGRQVQTFLDSPTQDDDDLAVLAQGINLAVEDLLRLRQVWGDEFWNFLRLIAAAPKRMKIRLLSGSLNDYRRATQSWWEMVEATVPALKSRRVYFISSNPHSLINLATGFALRNESELTQYIEGHQHSDLYAEWQDIEARNVPSNRENFLYYVLKKYLSTSEGQTLADKRREAETASGIVRIPAKRSFDIQSQIFELSRLRPDWVDPRLWSPDLEKLKHSDALILNLDYPLGMAAYLLLSHIDTRVGNVEAVYILGKAATLNGVIGDVLIPSVVHDEHSQNTYLFENCFTAANIEDDLVYGTVLDNQKAVTVRGTFLQNPSYMDVFYQEGYTDIEMEAGPYLSAIYEMVRPKRHPNNELVNLHGLPFDLGILHYASDTPLSKGKNLGAGSLSYFGMDPTYATSLAVLRRIFERELAYIGKTHQSQAVGQQP